MSGAETISIPPNWAVPAFDATVLAPRRCTYALVIPVINEGERIRSQLQRIRALDPTVDVVVADGGSTDGSLDIDFLREAGVKALLVKNGPGRLSAQLRMAYAWALARGYRGIITVDGNGKDDMEAIGRFVAALDQGYDLVQGSRYLPGGVAENTPVDRYLAGRFIHAPLISMRARHRFTDTTNGFRAYSAKALRDPRVAPFRHVFQDYNLLFYLLARIPRLGYRVTEIPVARRYPSGAVPTKVTGLAGRMRMLRELVSAVLGLLDPRDGHGAIR